MLKLTLIASAGLGAAALLLPVSGDLVDPVSKVGMGESRAYLHNYNLPAHGVALEGYSPVSYFESGKAEHGDRRFSTLHNGVTYYLASAEQVETFEIDPERYVPAFGGWCAFGMAIEDKFPIDPRNFKIVDGRLFVFLRNVNVDALQLWNQGSDVEMTRKAEAHWAKVNG